MTVGWGLIFITFLLVAFGVGLYVLGYEGWAELAVVLASGTAGGGVVLILEER